MNNQTGQPGQPDPPSGRTDQPGEASPTEVALREKLELQVAQMKAELEQARIQAELNAARKLIALLPEAADKLRVALNTTDGGKELADVAAKILDMSDMLSHTKPSAFREGGAERPPDGSIFIGNLNVLDADRLKKAIRGANPMMSIEAEVVEGEIVGPEKPRANNTETMGEETPAQRIARLRSKYGEQ